MSGTPHASAQTVPDPPSAPPALPPAPEQADPAIDVAGPAVQGVVGPLCSSLSGGLALALVVAVAVGGNEAAAINPIYQEVLTAQVAACGVLPPQPERTTCAPDAAVSDAIATAGAPTADAGAPVDPSAVLPQPRAAGGTVASGRAAEAFAVENGAPAPAAGDEAASALSCETMVVGGEFVPREFDPAAASAIESSETPLDAMDRPSSGRVDVPVVNDQGGTGLTTGAPTSAGDGALAQGTPVDDGAGSVAASELAAPAAATESGMAGKVAALVILGLLTGLSFIPSRLVPSRLPRT